MIEARYNGELTITGHDETDNRVCHAVSALTMTLHLSYGAPLPTSGQFTWRPTRGRANKTQLLYVLQFTLSFLNALAHEYPEAIRFVRE